MKRNSILVLAAFVLAAASALAQAPLTLPDASPAATVSQTIGLTDFTIAYHRPAVNKRKVWGELVPYGEVWRAGANMNTTFTSSSAFTVGGKTLPAGTYGLHMIPTEKDWTVIFSNMSTAWGSFSYDQKEDAVRFTATPNPADFEERLEYRFEDPTDASATVVLQWDKLAVSFPVTVDTKAVVFASIQAQMRGLPRFSWQGWNQAANWCLRNDYSLDEGLAWADRSIGIQANFQNLRTKAEILEKKGGDPKEVEALRAQAMKLATEADINLYGYQLMGQGKTAEALAVFRKNIKDYPNSWNTYDSLGEALATTGDKKGAIEYYGKALSMTTDPVQKKRINDILAKLKA
jgi:tetratricopeptide (TPR) repeat protein